MISAFISVCAAAAETTYPVSGLVLDRQSHEGIPYASVTILGDDDVRVQTDSLGYFMLNISPEESCRFMAMHRQYSSAVTDAVRISSCTPFIRIELDRQIRKSSDKTIDMMIHMADVMKKDICYDSLYIAFYAEHLAVLASADNIKNGKLPQSWKRNMKRKDTKKLSDDNQQFMLLRHRTAMGHKSEYAESHGGRRQHPKEAKRPGMRLRIVKKEDA